MCLFPLKFIYDSNFKTTTSAVVLMTRSRMKL